jgi:MOSC domain-containing protein YiiM
VESPGFVVSVNVGRPRVTEWHGRLVESAIWKAPVDGSVAVRGVNVDGDGQADHRVHGGVDKAVYAYAAEDYAWWSDRLGRAIEPATFGENLTTEGVDLNELTIGTRLRAGTAVLETAGPRMPCFKLGMRMGDASFVDVFDGAERYGAYFRIVQEGVVGAGDEIVVEPVDRPGVTVRELGASYGSPTPELLQRVLDDPGAGESLHEWARRGLSGARARRGRA